MQLQVFNQKEGKREYYDYFRFHFKRKDTGTHR